MGALVQLGQMAPVINREVVWFLPKNLVAAAIGVGIDRAIGQFVGALASRVASSRVSSLLMPDGAAIGRTGTEGVREMTGGLQEAKNLFRQVTAGGETVKRTNYPGTLVKMPNGSVIGFRTIMSRSPGTAATIDVNIKGIPFSKIKFNP